MGTGFEGAELGGQVTMKARTLQTKKTGTPTVNGRRGGELRPVVVDLTPKMRSLGFPQKGKSWVLFTPWEQWPASSSCQVS